MPFACFSVFVAYSQSGIVSNSRAVLCKLPLSFCMLTNQQTRMFRIRFSSTLGARPWVVLLSVTSGYFEIQMLTQERGACSALFSALSSTEPQWVDCIRPAETQEVCYMQLLYNGHCLGLERQALIKHGSHRELKPLKPAENPCCHSSFEVLALPLLLSHTFIFVCLLWKPNYSFSSSYWKAGSIREDQDGQKTFFSVTLTHISFCGRNSCWSRRNQTGLNSILFSLQHLKRSPSSEITDFLWVLFHCVAMGVMSPMECFIVQR